MEFQVTYILCNDVTWERFYDSQGWKYQRLEDILQLRGLAKPNLLLHEEELLNLQTPEEILTLINQAVALAELGHAHLEYAHIEDALVGEGEEVVIDKFFPTKV